MRTPRVENKMLRRRWIVRARALRISPRRNFRGWSIEVKLGRAERIERSKFRRVSDVPPAISPDINSQLFQKRAGGTRDFLSGIADQLLPRVRVNDERGAEMLQHKRTLPFRSRGRIRTGVGSLPFAGALLSSGTAVSFLLGNARTQLSTSFNTRRGRSRADYVAEQNCVTVRVSRIGLAYDRTLSR